MPEVTMPRLSDTMEEGTITRWLKKSGDQVKKGDTLAEVETDKATMEIEAYDSGVLENILVQEGVTAPIGQPIAVIGTGQGAKKEAQTATTVVTTKDVKAEPAAESAQAPGPSAESTASTDKAPAKDATASGRVSGEGAETLMGENGARLRISPIARRMAEEHSIDVRQVRGTGPGGRIVRDDIEDFLEQRQAQPQQQAAPPSAEAAAAPAQEKG